MTGNLGHRQQASGDPPAGEDLAVLWRRSRAQARAWRQRRGRKSGSKVLGTEISSNGPYMKSLLAEGTGRGIKNYATPASIQVPMCSYLIPTRLHLWFSRSGTGLNKSRHHRCSLNKEMNEYTWPCYCQKPRVQLSIFESYICRGKASPKRKHSLWWMLLRR